MSDSACHEKARFSVRRILLGVGVAFLLAAGIASYTFYTQEIAPHLSVRNPARYEEVLRDRWRFPEVTAHFPSTLPKDAQNVKFFCMPWGLQGGTSMRLNYVTSHSAVLSMVEKFGAESLSSFVGGDLNNHLAKEPGVHTKSPFNGDGTIFSNDYTVYVLQLKKVPKKMPRFSGVYDGSSGVAISVSSNDVVFWATIELGELPDVIPVR